MDLNGVRAFVAVALHGTIRDAARVLGYSESAVSRHIKAFERSMGGPVFARERAGMRLTDLGSATLPLARNVLDAIAVIADVPLVNAASRPCQMRSTSGGAAESATDLA